MLVLVNILPVNILMSVGLLLIIMLEKENY
nr:MAG TPA: hypothetical protein [Crassvirales sp.]